MRTSVVILLLVLSIGVAGRFLYRYEEAEIAWRTDKAVELRLLQQSEDHVKYVRILRSYPIEDIEKHGVSMAPSLVKDVNDYADTEVYSTKQELLRLYGKRGRSLSAEEAAQASRWKQDIADWEAEMTRRGEEARKLRQ